MFSNKHKNKTDIDLFNILIKHADENKEPFAAMLIDSSNNQILAYGINRYPFKPLMHSEIDAYSNYNDKVGNLTNQSKHLALYTTACPCPMCTTSLPYANIEKVVYGVSREFLINLGHDQFAGLSSEFILQHTKNPNKFEFKQINQEMVKKCEQLFEKYKDKYRFSEADDNIWKSIL